MNKDEMKKIEENECEMIKRLQSALPDAETMRFNFDKIDLATYLYDTGCRIIGDDEIVIKKSEQKQWLKDCIESNKKTEEIARKQTAREILQEIMSVETTSENFVKNTEFYEFVQKVLGKLEELANKYSVELED